MKFDLEKLTNRIRPDFPNGWCGPATKYTPKEKLVMFAAGLALNGLFAYSIYQGVRDFIDERNISKSEYSVPIEPPKEIEQICGRGRFLEYNGK